MWQPSLETAVFRLRVVITESSSLTKPMPIARQVAPIERVHRKVLCAESVASAKSSICEATLAEGFGNPANFCKSAPQLGHRDGVTSKCEMP